MFANLAIALVSLLSLVSASECPAGHLCAMAHTSAECDTPAVVSVNPSTTECYDFSGICSLLGMKETDCTATIAKFGFPIDDTTWSAKLSCNESEVSGALYNTAGCTGKPVGDMSHPTEQCEAVGPAFVRVSCE
jgi:hypothetical protein